MTHRIPLLMSMMLPTAAGAQWTCDSLSIPLLKYSAFHDSLLEVRITSSGFSSINYPTVVVYDNNGDTLAWDYGNFFALGPDQTFLVPVAAGAVPPVGYFDAIVEVYTNGMELQCTLFRPYTNLCPIEPCVALYPAVISAPSGHLFLWTVTDTDGNAVATDIMAVPEGATQTRDTVCLPPGEYSLGMVDITGIGMSAIFYMVGSDWWASPTSPHATVESGSASSFVLFEDCFEAPNGIAEVASVGTELRIANGILYVRRANDGMMREVAVVDATGRVVRAATVGKAACQMNVADLAAGILVVQVTGNDGVRSSRQRIQFGRREAEARAVISSRQKAITMLPRNFPAILTGLFLAAPALAQNDCADLTIASVRYSPLNATFVEVRILNSSGGGFGYPSLVLFDANGDTLAWGSTGLFGLGSDQTTAIQLLPGIVLPDDPFPAMLELWIGSWSQLACSFDLVIDPCPSEACTPVYPHVIAGNGNGGGLQFNWAVMDSAGTAVATGDMEIPEGANQIQDTVCLPVGAYSLAMVSPFGIGEFIYFTMIGSAWASSPQVEVESGDVSSFILFEACMEDANAIAEVTDQGLHLAIVNGVLRIWRTHGPPLRDVHVMDVAGRLVRSAAGQKTPMELDIAALPAGVLVVKATDTQEWHSCRRISWVP